MKGNTVFDEGGEGGSQAAGVKADVARDEGVKAGDGVTAKDGSSPRRGVKAEKDRSEGAEGSVIGDAWMKAVKVAA